MNSSVWMTVLISSIVYWGVLLIAVVFALLSSLMDKKKQNESKGYLESLWELNKGDIE